MKTRCHNCGKEQFAPCFEHIGLQDCKSCYIANMRILLFNKDISASITKLKMFRKFLKENPEFGLEI